MPLHEDERDDNAEDERRQDEQSRDTERADHDIGERRVLGRLLRQVDDERLRILLHGATADPSLPRGGRDRRGHFLERALVLEHRVAQRLGDALAVRRRLEQSRL